VNEFPNETEGETFPPFCQSKAAIEEKKVEPGEQVPPTDEDSDKTTHLDDGYECLLTEGAVDCRKEPSSKMCIT